LDRNEKYYKQFAQAKCCVLIPTYNNIQSLKNVLERVSIFTDQIIIINDGSTDETKSFLDTVSGSSVIHLQQNKGKGFAIRAGFDEARKMGYKYAITIDSDGQHYPENLPEFIDKLKSNPETILLGSRNMNRKNIPTKSSFGNRFSNFWFWVNTGIWLPDTQSGYRLYPLEPLQSISFKTNRFEFEVEVLVRSSWRGVPILSVAVDVFYPEKEKRVSHFRPFTDFLRISILNTILVLIALFYVKPVQVIKGFNRKNLKAFFTKHLLNPQESNFKKSASVAWGIFMGIVPVWGWQTIIALSLAFVFRLNKIITLMAANISIPPMIPIILYVSYITGGLLLGNGTQVNYQGITFEFVMKNLYQYVIGACVFAAVFGIFCGLLTYVLLVIFRKKPVLAKAPSNANLNNPNNITKRPTANG